MSLDDKTIVIHLNGEIELLPTYNVSSHMAVGEKCIWNVHGNKWAVSIKTNDNRGWKRSELTDHDRMLVMLYGGDL